MADGVSPFLFCNLDQAFGDAGTRMAGSKQVVLVDSAGFHGGDDIVINIFIRQIQDIQL